MVQKREARKELIEQNMIATRGLDYVEGNVAFIIIAENKAQEDVTEDAWQANTEKCKVVYQNTNSKATVTITELDI